MPESATRKKKIRDARYSAGFKDGKAEAYRDILTFLEEKYVKSENLKTSPEDQAILTVARSISEHMKGRE